MNIQQFRYVLAIEELKHFEQAAQKCFVTQSTLSTMVGKLEDELGIQIFDRKTKPVSITQEGQEIIAQLQIIVKEIDSLEVKIQELKGEIVGNLKIGVIPTIAPYLLPLFLSDFAKKFSSVKITVQEMTTPEIQKGLKNRTLDIGIAAIPLEDPALREILLYQEPFLLFDCREIQDLKNRVGIKDLDYSYLLLLEDGHCLRTQVQKICNLSHKNCEPVMNFEFKAGSIDSLIRFTKSHQGITFLPLMATLDLKLLDKKRIKRFTSPEPIRSVGLVVYKHFVKSHLLDEVQRIIQHAIKKIIPPVEEGSLFKPM